VLHIFVLANSAFMDLYGIPGKNYVIEDHGRRRMECQSSNGFEIISLQSRFFEEIAPGAVDLRHIGMSDPSSGEIKVELAGSVPVLPHAGGLYPQESTQKQLHRLNFPARYILR
jgi:hypothetical protein